MERFLRTVKEIIMKLSNQIKLAILRGMRMTDYINNMGLTKKEAKILAHTVERHDIAARRFCKKYDAATITQAVVRGDTLIVYTMVEP